MENNNSNSMDDYYDNETLKEICLKELRATELSAYSEVINALRASGELDEEKNELINTINKYWNISIERFKGEVRRVNGDEKLRAIADTITGTSTSNSWTRIGYIPLLPPHPNLNTNNLIIHESIKKFNNTFNNDSKDHKTPELMKITKINLPKNALNGWNSSSNSSDESDKEPTIKKTKINRTPSPDITLSPSKKKPVEPKKSVVLNNLIEKLNETRPERRRFSRSMSPMSDYDDDRRCGSRSPSSSSSSSSCVSPTENLEEIREIIRKKKKMGLVFNLKSNATSQSSVPPPPMTTAPPAGFGRGNAIPIPSAPPAGFGRGNTTPTNRGLARVRGRSSTRGHGRGALTLNRPIQPADTIPSPTIKVIKKREPNQTKRAPRGSGRGRSNKKNSNTTAPAPMATEQNPNLTNEIHNIQTTNNNTAHDNRQVSNNTTIANNSNLITKAQLKQHHSETESKQRIPMTTTVTPATTEQVLPLKVRHKTKHTVLLQDEEQYYMSTNKFTASQPPPPLLLAPKMNPNMQQQSSPYNAIQNQQSQQQYPSLLPLSSQQQHYRPNNPPLLTYTRNTGLINPIMNTSTSAIPIFSTTLLPNTSNNNKRKLQLFSTSTASTQQQHNVTTIAPTPTASTLARSRLEIKPSPSSAPTTPRKTTQPHILANKSKTNQQHQKTNIGIAMTTSNTGAGLNTPNLTSTNITLPITSPVSMITTSSSTGNLSNEFINNGNTSSNGQLQSSPGTGIIFVQKNATNQQNQLLKQNPRLVNTNIELGPSSTSTPNITNPINSTTTTKAVILRRGNNSNVMILDFQKPNNPPTSTTFISTSIGSIGAPASSIIKSPVPITAKSLNTAKAIQGLSLAIASTSTPVPMPSSTVTSTARTTIEVLQRKPICTKDVTTKLILNTTPQQHQFIIRNPTPILLNSSVTMTPTTLIRSTGLINAAVPIIQQRAPTVITSSTKPSSEDSVPQYLLATETLDFDDEEGQREQVSEQIKVMLTPESSIASSKNKPTPVKSKKPTPSPSSLSSQQNTSPDITTTGKTTANSNKRKTVFVRYEPTNKLVTTSNAPDSTTETSLRLQEETVIVTSTPE